MNVWPREHIDHLRVVRCLTCGWYELHEKAPLLAHTRASRHARRFAGDDVVVINLELLTVEGKYQHYRLPADGDAAPF